MTDKAKVAKNTSYFTLALIFQKIITFAYFALIAKNFSPADLGKYYFAISFATIFNIFIDLGIANLATREGAKSFNYDSTRPQKILSNTLALRLFLALLTFAAAMIVSYLLGYSTVVRNLIFFALLATILDSFSLLFYSLIRGFHNLFFESLSAVIFPFLVLLGGFLLMRQGASIRWLIIPLALASAVNCLFSGFLLRFRFRLKLKPALDFVYLKAFLIMALPFAGYAIIQRFYTYFDTVLLSILTDDHQVGIYQIPFKIINAFQFLPMALAASLYPFFSAEWKRHKENLSQPAVGLAPAENHLQKLQIGFQQSCRYLIIIALPVSLGIFTLARPLLLLFRPEYLEALLPLRWSIFSLIFIFLGFPVGALLNGCDRQKANTMIMLVVFLFSIVSNLIFIPWAEKTSGQGAIGASLTVLLASIFFFVLGWKYAMGLISINYKNFILTLSKTSLAAGLMTLLVMFLSEKIPLLVLILISGLAYGTGLLVLREVSWHEIRRFLRLFKNKDLA